MSLIILELTLFSSDESEYELPTSVGRDAGEIDYIDDGGNGASERASERQDVVSVTDETEFDDDGEEWGGIALSDDSLDEEGRGMLEEGKAPHAVVK